MIPAKALVFRADCPDCHGTGFAMTEHVEADATAVNLAWIYPHNCYADVEWVKPRQPKMERP